MIDVHSHILPGIDDGAKDITTSMKMAKKAVANGIDKIIATPHHQNGIYYNDYDSVADNVKKMNQLLTADNIPLTISPGNETRIYIDFLQDLKNNQFLTLNDTNKYVLLELPLNSVPRFTEHVIFEIQLAGFIPIIPHPERNEDVRNNPNKIYQLVKQGALTQITSGSLLGIFGREIQKFSFEMIDSNLTHLIATDAHSEEGERSFNLYEAYNAIGNFAGIELVEQLKSNAENIFYGKDLYSDVPIKMTRKKKRFGII